jgi:hypothetical protein
MLFVPPGLFLFICCLARFSLHCFNSNRIIPGGLSRRMRSWLRTLRNATNVLLVATLILSFLNPLLDSKLMLTENGSGKLHTWLTLFWFCGVLTLVALLLLHFHWWIEVCYDSSCSFSVDIPLNGFVPFFRVNEAGFLFERHRLLLKRQQLVLLSCQ